jgi:hypothetical protein
MCLTSFTFIVRRNVLAKCIYLDLFSLLCFVIQCKSLLKAVWGGYFAVCWVKSPGKQRKKPGQKAYKLIV